jgi:lipopolysaccharide export system protein LptC
VTADDNDISAPKGAPRERLKHLPTRQRLTGDQAARRSAIVRRLRIALPALAIGLVGVLFLNSREDAEDAFLDDFAAADAAPQELEMAKPRFAGVDDKGRPYEITADEARQATDADNVVELSKPRALTRADDEKTLVTADRGVYRKDENELDLSTDVRLNHQIGDEIYVLTTSAAKVSIKGETVETTSGVEGVGQSGALRADSMRAYNADGRVVFEGNVRMRFDPKAAAATEAKTDGAPL